jgi:peptide/nickel transport system permease protein
MIGFIVQRLGFAALTLFVSSILAFVIIQLPPGDFVDTYIANLSASGSAVSQGEAEALRQLYGLDQPMAVQYFKWISRVVVGDFGESMEWRRPVSEAPRPHPPGASASQRARCSRPRVP